MKWVHKDLGSRLHYLFFKYALKLVGSRITTFILVFVVLYYVLNPTSRQCCKAYISRRFKPESFWQLLKHTWSLYFTFAQITLLTMQSKLGVKPVFVYNCKQREQIKSILTAGCGCLVVSAHVGAWRLGALQDLQTPVHILSYEDNKGEFFNQDLSGVKLINIKQPFGGLLQAAEALRRNEIVCMMGDRILSQEKYVEVVFMGDKIYLPVTAYMLSQLTKSPIVMVFNLYLDESIHTISGGVINPGEPGNYKNPAAHKQMAQAFATAMEKITIQYPYQFFNFYDMWAQYDKDRVDAKD